MRFFLPRRLLRGLLFLGRWRGVLMVSWWKKVWEAWFVDATFWVGGGQADRFRAIAYLRRDEAAPKIGHPVLEC